MVLASKAVSFVLSMLYAPLTASSACPVIPPPLQPPPSPLPPMMQHCPSLPILDSFASQSSLKLLLETMRSMRRSWCSNGRRGRNTTRPHQIEIRIVGTIRIDDHVRATYLLILLNSKHERRAINLQVLEMRAATLTERRTRLIDDMAQPLARHLSLIQSAHTSGSLSRVEGNFLIQQGWVHLLQEVDDKSAARLVYPSNWSQRLFQVFHVRSLWSVLEWYWNSHALVYFWSMNVYGIL